MRLLRIIKTKTFIGCINKNNSELAEWLEAEKLKRRRKQKTYPCL